MGKYKLRGDEFAPDPEGQLGPGTSVDNHVVVQKRGRGDYLVFDRGEYLEPRKFTNQEAAYAYADEQAGRLGCFWDEDVGG